MPVDLQPHTTTAFLPAASQLLQHIPELPSAEASISLSLATTEPSPISSFLSAVTPTVSALTTLLPDPAATAAPAMTQQPQDVQASVPGDGSLAERDPAQGAFLGGEPLKNVDVPVAFIFLILFALGAFRHISTYRANAKRGHKFLLSDLMFDFCMVRVLTCIFRIIWAFIHPRGVVLAANIFENGGAAVIFAVNLFFAQRIVRAMHPKVGWHPAFSYSSLFLILSVPAVIIMNIISLSVSFFSVGKPGQLEATETALKFGVVWNMMLSVMPLIWIFVACAFPGPEPENFGTGDFRAKTALVVYSTSTLAFGAAIRLTATFNPEMPGTESVLYGKAVFYTTGFMLEILTVALYAVARIDLLFYIPDGASGPGDYSRKKHSEGDEEKQGLSRDEVEREIRKLGVEYEVLQSGREQTDSSPMFTVFYPKERRHFADAAALAQDQSEGGGDGALPPRASRVSRRQSLMQALRPERPPRANRSTLYLTTQPESNPPFPEKDTTYYY